jgi:hypothetical protein
MKVMKITYYILLTFLLAFCKTNVLHSQVFLQLEESKEVKAHKYFPGDVIMIKTTEFPKIWQRHRLERLLVEEETLITSEGLITLEEITHVKLFNPTLSIVGKGFMTFGSGWFLFGGLGSLYEMRLIMTGSQIALGGAAMVVGYIFWKYASQRTVKLGTQNRLRLLDISFPAPSIGEKP